MKNRLGEHRKRLGYTFEWVAERLGVNISTASRHEKSFNFPVTYLQQYADLYGVTVADLITDVRQLDHVIVRGAVEAGAWKEAREWPEDEWYQASVHVPGSYKHARTFGLEVRGTSMNETYPEGSLLVCVPYGDIARAPEDTDHIVIARRSPETDEVEVTVKELSYRDGLAYLWPRTSDPQQDPRAIPLDGEDVEPIAMVIGAYIPRKK